MSGSRSIRKRLVPDDALRWIADPPKPGLFLLAGVLLCVLGQIVFVSAGSQPTAPVFGIVLMASGLVLFGLGAKKRPIAIDSAFSLSDVVLPWRIFKGRRFLVPAAGAIFLLVLLLRLLNGSKYASDLWLWAIAIVGFAVPFLQYVRLPRGLLHKRVIYEAIFILALMGLFIALNILDMTDWYYSAIGDEYAFYNEAQGIIKNGISRPFSQAGVYGEQPELNSVYTASVMSLFGANNLGWKLASVLLVALSIPGVYLIGRGLGGIRVAAISAMLFGFSHYLFASVHTGHNNVNAIFPAVWAMAIFVFALKRSNPLLLYMSGLMAGLGFYTYYSSRAILPIMVLFAFTQPRWWKQLLNLWPVLMGFALIVLPIFASSKGAVISQMLVETAGGYSNVVTGPTGERIVSNIHDNVLAFNYSPHIFQYVSGSLLDPITAVLAVLGIGLALRHLKLDSLRLLLIWYAVAITATGILSPYPTVATSRLSFVVPPLTILAAVVANYVWSRMPAPLWFKDHWRAWGAAAAILGVLVLAMNANRFWNVAPTKAHLSQEAVAIGALRSELCRNDYDTTLIIGRGVDALLKPALLSYAPDGKLPRMIDQKDVARDGLLAMDGLGCVVLMSPMEQETELLAAKLQDAYPGGQLVTFSDKANKGSVKVFVADGSVRKLE